MGHGLEKNRHQNCCESSLLGVLYSWKRRHPGRCKVDGIVETAGCRTPSYRRNCRVQPPQRKDVAGAVLLHVAMYIVQWCRVHCALLYKRCVFVTCVNSACSAFMCIGYRQSVMSYFPAAKRRGNNNYFAAQKTIAARSCCCNAATVQSC